jgi:membrane protease YdiL (CAAX protease family)
MSTSDVIATDTTVETERYATLRVRPTAVLAVAVVVAYGLVMFVMWKVLGVDYETFTDSTDGIVEAVVVSVAVGSVFLVIAATVLGWWRPALREEHRVGRGWMFLAPVAMLMVPVVSLATTDFGRVEAGFVVAAAAGTLLVGFAEELATRGLAIVGLRGSVPEKWVWFGSCLLFALLHGINVLVGQAIGPTVQQMVFAFAAGIVFYVTRRITGLLVVTMVLHALWDFSTFVHENSGADSTPIGTPFLLLAVIVGIIALVKILHSGDVVDAEAIKA